MSRILIVEDEEALRGDLVDYMCLQGFEATGVGTAAELLAVLRNDVLPHVVILDIALPDGDGFNLAGSIRAQLDCGIIMLTAHGDTESRVRGFRQRGGYLSGQAHHPARNYGSGSQLAAPAAEGPDDRRCACSVGSRCSRLDVARTGRPIGEADRDRKHIRRSSDRKRRSAMCKRRPGPHPFQAADPIRQPPS